MKKRVIAVFITCCILITFIIPVFSANKKVNEEPIFKKTINNQKTRKQQVYKQLKKIISKTNRSKGAKNSNLKSIKKIKPSTLNDLNGDGTKNNPYEIKSLKDLLSIKENLNAHYSLLVNIDLRDYYEWESIGIFTGEFTGNSKTIKGLSDEPLFTEIDGGSVKGMIFEDCNIVVDESGSYGLLAGNIKNNSKITNCNIKYPEWSFYFEDEEDEDYDAFKEGIEHSIFVSTEKDNGDLELTYGSLIGKSTDSVIQHCSVQKGMLFIATCHFDTMPGIDARAIKISANIGGIVGVAKNSEIIDCKNLVGTSFMSVLDDSKKDQLSQDINIGGVVGYAENTKINGLTGNANSVENETLIYSDKIDNNIDSFISNTGGVVGKAHDCDIENVFNTGYVSFNDVRFSSGEQLYPNPEIYTGGIVGNASGGTSIKKARCESYTIDGYEGLPALLMIFNYTNNTTAYTGGIAGLLEEKSYIENSANAAMVTGVSEDYKRIKMYSGGLVGKNTSSSSHSIKTSYNAGHTQELAKGYKESAINGGLVGKNEAAFATNNYYVSSASKSVGVGNGAGKGSKLSAAAMKSKSSFKGFDFKKVYEFNGKNNYKFPNIKGNNFTTKFVKNIDLYPEKLTLYTGLGSKYDRAYFDYDISPYNTYCDEFKIKNTNIKVANIKFYDGWADSAYSSFHAEEDVRQIRAFSPGKTAITIISMDGAEVSSNKLTITVKKGIKLKKLTLSKKDVTLKKKKKYKLQVKYSPSNASIKGVKYKTLNKKIATVSSKGVITAKKKGKTKIEITSKYNSKIKVYCIVKVK